MSDADLPFVLTLHARVVLAARGIEPAWVSRVLAAPARTEADTLDPSLHHALGPIDERGGRMLRIVYNPGVSPILVVTAFFDRREGRAP